MIKLYSLLHDPFLLSFPFLSLSQDTNNASLMVGLASSGVAIFRNMICSSFFPWCVWVSLMTRLVVKGLL